MLQKFNTLTRYFWNFVVVTLSHILSFKTKCILFPQVVVGNSPIIIIVILLLLQFLDKDKEGPIRMYDIEDKNTEDK